MSAAALLIASCLLGLPQAAGPQRTTSGPPYKMRTYQLVILKKGPAASTAETAAGQKAIQHHIAYMYKLGAEGTSVAAGPLLDGGEIQGLMFMNASTPEEAKRIEDADPAVQAGIFMVEVLPFLSPEGWFGKWADQGTLETVYFGFLNSGPNRGQDPETARRLQSEHLAYMAGQSEEGKLVVAGPFAIEGPRRGVVVYRVADEVEAKRRAEADPMVRAGRLAVELHPWQVPVGALPRPH